MALAERAGLAALIRQHVQAGGGAGVNADLKAGCLVAGMAAGADSIDDMDVLRHGAMAEVFGGVRAPSTLGSFLRSFTWGSARQLEKASRVLLSRLAAAAPLLPGADVLAFIDIDSMQKRVYGHAKAGAGFGHTKIQGKSLLVRGLNVLAPWSPRRWRRRWSRRPGCAAARRARPGERRRWRPRRSALPAPRAARG
jgi:hypothetical protein